MKSKDKPKTGRLPSLRIVLVDDHVLLLDVMKRQFDSDPAFEVVATAESLAALMDAIDRIEVDPDAILLDVELGGESGLDAIIHLREMCPEARIVILSMFDHEIYRDRAFELGADAYVAKGARFEDLRNAVIDVIANDEATVKTKRSGVWRRTEHGGGVRLTLTARELQVLRALAYGKRERDVAADLDISVSSVGTYLKRAMDKTGIATRAELLRYAAALGTESEKEG